MSDWSSTYTDLPSPQPSSWQYNHDREISDRNLQRARKYTAYFRTSFHPLPFPNDDTPKPPPPVSFDISDDAPTDARRALREILYQLECLSYVRAHVKYEQTTAIPWQDNEPEIGYVFTVIIRNKLLSQPDFTKQILLRVAPESEGWMDFQLRDTKTWINMFDIRSPVETRAEQMNIAAAQVFVPGLSTPPHDAKSAETVINQEIERRINARRVAEIDSPQKDRLSALPAEIQMMIFHYTMCPDIQHDINTTFWPYRGSHLGGQYLTLAHTNPDVQVLRLSKQLRNAAREALYHGFSFGFPTAVKARRFFNQVDDSSLSFMRYITLVFEADVTLAFLRSTLGFNFMKTGSVITNDINGYDFQALLSDIDQRFGDGTITITLRFPFARRMYNARYGDSCHFTLCKWIVKAATDALKNFNHSVQLDSVTNSLAATRLDNNTARTKLEKKAAAAISSAQPANGGTTSKGKTSTTSATSTAASAATRAPRIKLIFQRGDRAGYTCDSKTLKQQDEELQQLHKDCEAGKIRWEDLGVLGPKSDGELPELWGPPTCECSNRFTTYEREAVVTAAAG